MLVTDAARIAASQDRRLLELRVADEGDAVGETSVVMFRVFRGGYLAKLYMYVPHDPGAITSISHAIAASVGVATLTVSAETWQAAVEINPDTGTVWQPGEVTRCAVEGDGLGRGLVLECMLTTAVDREGNSAVVASTFRNRGTHVEWLDQQPHQNVVDGYQQTGANVYVEQMLEPFTRVDQPDVDQWTAQLLNESLVPELAQSMHGRPMGAQDNRIAQSTFAVPGTPRHQAACRLWGKGQVSDARPYSHVPVN